MITDTIKAWFQTRWQPENVDNSLAEAYVVAFSSFHGQRVLQHLFDTVYCTIYTGTNPDEANAINARRSVVHEILVNIDKGQHPMKYKPQVVEKEQLDGNLG